MAISEAIADMAVGGVSAAASIANTKLTNKTNKEIADKNNETQLQIHKEDREFNADEAEKSREFNALEAEKAREFNALEAEKAREWNSELAQVERRKDAGLNTAVVGAQTASTSSAQASSPSATSSPAVAPSAPSLVTPTIQAPDLSKAVAFAKDVVTFANDASISRSEEKRLKSLAEKQILETQYSGENFNLLLQKQKLSNIEQEYVNDKVKMELQSAFQAGYSQWLKNEMSVDTFNANINQFLVNSQIELAKLNQDAEMFVKEWSNRQFAESYHYGKVVTNRQDWNIGGKAGINYTSASDSNTSSNLGKFGKALSFISGKLPSAGIDGRYSDLDESRQVFQNTDYYRTLVEAKACQLIMSNPKYSDNEHYIARSRLSNLSKSFEMYIQWMRHAGKHVNVPNSLREDLEPQQIP